MNSNIEKLQAAVEKISDCAIIADDINRRYFTKMKSSAGTLLVFPEKSYFIIDFRYIEKAKKTVTDCEVILQGKLYEQINSLIERHGAKTLSVDAASCTMLQLAEYKEKLNCDILGGSDFSESIRNIRIIKSQSEIEKIIAAQRIAEKGFEHILEYIIPGRTEREIQLELDYFMLKNGAEALSFDTIALSGRNTSLPHGVPSDKKIEQGEFVLLDFGAVVDGWHSDMTRTVCAGSPTDEMRKVYNIVLEAQLAALDNIKSGMTGSEIDKIARDIISNNGYKENFGHSLGHGVGMDIHEAPTASSASNEIFKENMIVTVEPGIYIENKFGVRIEDFVIVNKNGCENMTKSPKQLISL